mmetsp:Transcript_47054/g.124712  ORF Transcript_47054/g.124712 Transcript_47054/m.124712 type:complete len:207 (+) Transcript_47054:590-1210(+)
MSGAGNTRLGSWNAVSKAPPDPCVTTSYWEVANVDSLRCSGRITSSEMSLLTPLEWWLYRPVRSPGAGSSSSLSLGGIMGSMVGPSARGSMATGCTRSGVPVHGVVPHGSQSSSSRAAVDVTFCAVPSVGPVPAPAPLAPGSGASALRSVKPPAKSCAGPPGGTGPGTAAPIAGPVPGAGASLVSVRGSAVAVSSASPSTMLGSAF